MANFCCIELIIDSISKIANIVIAIATFILAFYVFIYKRNKDKRDRRIQWLKDLIIAPKLKIVENYFQNIHDLKREIKSNDLSESDKTDFLKLLKTHSSTFRKEFLLSLQSLAPNLFTTIQKKIDNLTDEITNAISNDELKLCNEKTYDREIGEKVREVNIFVLREIFEYNGE